MTLSFLRPAPPPSLTEIAASKQGDSTPLRKLRGIGAPGGSPRWGRLLTGDTARRRVAEAIAHDLKARYGTKDAETKNLRALVLAHLRNQGVSRISTLGDLRKAQRYVQDDLLKVKFEKGSDEAALTQRLNGVIGGLDSLKQMLASLTAALGTELYVKIAEGKTENNGAITVEIRDSMKSSNRKFLCQFAMNEARRVVDLNALSVGEDIMGGAHAKLVLKALVDLMGRSKGGLDALELQANINIGTYAWAKAFHPRDPEQLWNIMGASIGRFERYRSAFQGAMKPEDFDLLDGVIQGFEGRRKAGELDNGDFDALRDIKLPVDMAKATDELREDPTLKDVKEAVQGQKMAAGKLLMILSSYHGGAWYGRAQVGQQSWKDLLRNLYPEAPSPHDL